MTNIDEKLTELLKGKIVKKVEMSAFPDIFIFFEDGTSLHYELETEVNNRTDGDKEILNINVGNNKISDLYNKSIERRFTLRGDWF